MIKESNNLIIDYHNELDYLDEMVNKLESEINKVSSFFNVKLNDKIRIIIYDTKEGFDEKFYYYHKFKCDGYGVGFVIEDIIHVLSFNDYINTLHKNEYIEFFYKIINHELIHAIYLIYNANPIRCLNEGLPLYLCNQYDSVDYSKLNITINDIKENKNVDYYNYFLIVNYIFNNFNKEEILKILKDNEYGIRVIENVLKEVK